MKVINAHNQSGYTVQNLEANGKFDTLLDMKSQLKQGCSEYLCDDDEFQCGYIQRGHGQKGKQFLISSDSEIADMYCVYQGKQDIMLWMKVKSGNPRKRKRSSSVREQAGNSKGSTSSDIEDITPSPKQRKAADTGSTVKPGGTQYQKHLKMSEVEVIIEDLEEKHVSDGHGKYSAEQIRVWAHMLHMKKHDSYTDPPNKPFFRNSKSAKNGSASTSTDGMSPAKKIQVRTELIQQLDKWHALMERGAIDLQRYQELYKIPY